MENASKALIIAGAILITLIIIGLGVAILGSTEGATDTSTFDAMQVSSFNNKFKPYEGTIQGSKLDALCDILLATARSAGENGKAERPQIYLKGKDASNKFEVAYTVNGTAVSADSDILDADSSATYIAFIKALKKEIQSADRYTLEMETDNNTDLIHKITITKK